jgi:hypothetical protein
MHGSLYQHWGGDSVEGEERQIICIGSICHQKQLFSATLGRGNFAWVLFYLQLSTSIPEN